MGDDWRDDRVGTALRGDNPTVLQRLTAGFAVIGDVQFLPGYCVLLTDHPAADRLTDLPRAKRLAFLDDMELLGQAVERVCSRRDPAFRRINYEILGNHDAFLHAHIWPRYEWEPDNIRSRPVWLYAPEMWQQPQTALGSQHDELRSELTSELAALRSQAVRQPASGTPRL
jgi:diadenosine tetraphosphate (Ap4A) HIT family hydrolase